MVRRDRIRCGRVVAARVLFWAVTLAVIALAPIILLVGEPLGRDCLRRLSRPPLRARSARALSRAGLRRGFLRPTARRGPPVPAPRYGVGCGRRGPAPAIEPK